MPAKPRRSGSLNSPSAEYLTTSQAAAYIGLARKTLETWRTNGSGPRFIKVSAGAVRYKRSDLDAFMADRTVSSTSEWDERNRGAASDA